ncbi:MAG: DNA repair protein RadC [Oscillospiraceae bacterium]
MGIHDGHRERMKNQFLKNGLDAFEPHQVLELLLFYTRPRGDTNVLSHILLERYETLTALFDAPYDELLQIDGVGTSTATFIKMLPQLFSIYMCGKIKEGDCITSTKSAGEYFVPKFLGKKNEELHMLSLDDKHKIIRAKKLFEGTVNATAVAIKSIVAEAVSSNATTVIIAHNHPGGVALPSSNDKIVTQKILMALDLINIRLEDHIIVADDDFVSLADSGYLQNFRQ